MKAKTLADALNRLDQDITDLEQRLAALRATRKSIVPFLEHYMGADFLINPEDETQSLTDEVVAIFKQWPQSILGVDDVHRLLQKGGSCDAPRNRVRNAVNYAARCGKIYRVPNQRGKFSLQEVQ